MTIWNDTQLYWIQKLETSEKDTYNYMVIHNWQLRD